MYMLGVSIFTSFYDSDIRFWNCSDSVAFTAFHMITKTSYK